MKKILTALLVFLVPIFVCGYSVQLTWDASPNVTGYIVWYGTQSGSYTNEVNVGNQTSTIITNLISPEYFAVSDYDINGNSSSYSQELEFIPTLNTNFLTQVEILVRYGTILNLQTNLYSLLTLTNASPQFYSGTLIVAGKPRNSSPIQDGSTNTYTYLTSQLEYGTNITSLTTNYIDFAIFTNAPIGQGYNGSLIIQK